ncbi:MAG: hypothetical protein LAT67_14370 [Balneolales bacterium]|nr:hypothetical protein [Balneolales bacterium]
MLPEIVQAQTQVRILQTGTATGSVTEFGQTRKLFDDVIIETDDMLIKADSLFQYIEADLIDAFGNIEIITENQTIWADSLRYNLNTDVSHFRGRVVVQGESSLLLSPEMIYNFFFEIAEFPREIRLEDADGTLKADRGFYFNIPDSAAFFGNVQLSDSTQYAESDSLYAIRSANRYQLFGNVYLEDFENRTRMRGDFSKSDDSGYRELRGNARLQRMNEAETDTTFLSASWLEVLQDDTTSVVLGYENVRIWSERYASVSDSSRYEDIAGRFLLKGDSRLWRRDLQLSSRIIEIILQDDEIEELIAYPEPITVTPDSITGRFNQIQGDSLWIFFDEGEIHRMEVRPNSEMIIHEKDENDEPEFAVQIEADRLFVFFANNEPDSLKYFENISGQFIPEARNPGEIRLSRFQYEPEIRPERPERWLQPSRPPLTSEPPFEWPARYRIYLEERNRTGNR